MSTPSKKSRPNSLHLSAADFDAYLPDRATSNTYSRPRLELKQRTLAWAKGVVGRLAKLGIAVEVTGSEEHPSLRNGRRVDCQRVFFRRDAASRAELERIINHKKTLAAALRDPAPHSKHAFLALKIDSVHIEVSVEVHPDAWVDAKNLRARLAEPGHALELTAALEALPEQFAVGIAADHEPRALALRLTADQLRALCDLSVAEASAVWIGWSVPRHVAVTHSSVLDEQLEDAIIALGPVFKLIAWAPDNDLLVLGREVEAARNDRLRAHAEAERERTEWEAQQDRDQRRSRTRPTPRGREQQKTRRDGASARAIAATDGEWVRVPRELGSEPKLSAGARVRPSLHSSKSAARTVTRRALVTDVDPRIAIEKGTRVRVLAGPFVGKIGVVQELDGKGHARVMLGLLATRVAVKDLIGSAEGKARRALSSSHRKPIPARG